MTTNSGKVIKIQLPLNEYKQRHIGIINTHMYRLKSTEGEETPNINFIMPDANKIPQRKSEFLVKHQFLTLR